MKYVPLSSDVQKFLDKHNMQSFQPLKFDKALCEGMIQLIRESSEQGRVVNHDELASSRKDRSGISGIGIGLAIAAVGLVGALIYASTMV
jgi:hypothetical protein